MGLSLNARTTATFREATSLFFQLNLWLVVTTILMTGATALTLGVSLRELGVGIALPSFLVYFVYVRERRLIPDEDRINHPYRTQLVTKYDAPLHVSELLALAAYELLLAASIPMRTAEGAVMLGLAHVPVVVLYVYADLKGNPGVDSLAVAVAWAYLVVYSVVVLSGGPVSPAVGVVFLGWVVIVFAGVESRNLEDADGDERIGNDTLASRLGASRTKRLEWGAKVGGVALFLTAGGWRVGLLVVIYLLLLRLSRAISENGKYGRVVIEE